MEYKFSKKSLETLKLNEQCYKVFKKSDLLLREVVQGTAVVGSAKKIGQTLTTANSLSSELNKAKTQNPTAANYQINGEDIDSNKANDNFTQSITATNPSDAATQINSYENSEVGKKIGLSNTTFNITYSSNLGEEKNRIRRNAIRFSKKELNDLIF